MLREVRIYVEGGGDRKDTKRAMREGFRAFLAELRQAARSRGIHWHIIACGSRESAIRGFFIALRHHREAFNVLLVDAEGPVSSSARDHVFAGNARRSEVEDEQCHLMVQMMEAWLVADPDALATFYGKDFRAAAIPPRRDVEAIDKAKLESALRNATRDTQKGEYHKIKHGAELLRRVDPGVVRAKARHCDRLFTTLSARMAGG